MRTEEGAMLLAIARAAISGSLEMPHPTEILLAPGASFVTLTQAGELRGCMGSLQPYRSLRDDVQANAMAAAFRDPRFPPLTHDELPFIHIEVSVLSAAESIVAASETEALAQLRPGRDGVILEYGPQRATFLPQVWDDLKDKQQFIVALKRKAGLAADFWAPDLRLSRYTVEKWAEADDGETLLQSRRE